MVNLVCSSVSIANCVSYEVIFAPTARREMSNVPERIIPAIIEFVYGDLAGSRP